MQTLIFRTADEKTALQGIIAGLGSTPEQDVRFQARLAAEAAFDAQTRGMSHEGRQRAALEALDAQLAARR